MSEGPANGLIGGPPTLRHRVQSGIARVLKRLGFDPLWYDVATFSVRGHECVNCGRRSHTERKHLGHDC